MITRVEFENHCIKYGLRYRHDNDFWNKLLNENWNENILCYLCVSGYIETAKWLVSLGGVDIHADNDCAFRWSYEYEHKEIIEWFMFKLGFLNNPIIDNYSMCQQIIHDRIFCRKRILFNGYIQNGFKSLFSDKVSLSCFKECLLME